MTEPPADLPSFLDLGWRRLTLGVSDRHAAARTLTLATVTEHGTPTLRSVVLRATDRDAGWIEFHTDRASAKVSEITRCPDIALHVWDPQASLQLRITARAEVVAGSPEQWAALPDGARRVYGGTPLPGHPLDRPEDFDPTPDLSRYCLVRCRLETLDLLLLTPDLHRRARFGRGTNWVGQWVAP